MWQAWEQRFPEQIRPSISISVDLVDPSELRPDEAGNYRVPEAIKALDTGYLPLKAYLEQTRSSGDTRREHTCAICRGHIHYDDSRHLACPDCLARSHVNCLANEFLKDQGDSVLPIEGRCPRCHGKVKWDVMVREMSLRLRGQKEVDKVFREKKRKRTDSGKDDGPAPEPERDDGGDEDMGDDKLEDDWIFQTFDDDDTNTVASESERCTVRDESPPQKRSKAISKRQHSPIIEESDRDDVIVID